MDLSHAFQQMECQKFILTVCNTIIDLTKKLSGKQNYTNKKHDF